MKYCQTTLAILAVLYASLAVAEDFKTIKGKEYKKATVSRVEPDGIVVITKSGISKVYFTELPKEVQKRFGYDADKLEAEKAAARAAQEKRIQEKKEREGNADADLKQSLGQFQVAERRASQDYQSATKGILSGQVFVSTKGGESRKLGAVQVGLYARDAIDALLAGLKKYADIKIQELSPSLDAARAASEEADAAKEAAYDAARQSVSNLPAWTQATAAALDATIKYQSIRTNVDFYHSGSFYFKCLLSPIHTAETDAEGKFVMNVPKHGSFVIAAKSERYLGEIDIGESRIPNREHHYWLQSVSLEGQQQSVQNLSNKNLTSTTGTSSLIHTQDFLDF